MKGTQTSEWNRIKETPKCIYSEKSNRRSSTQSHHIVDTSHTIISIYSCLFSENWGVVCSHILHAVCVLWENSSLTYRIYVYERVLQTPQTDMRMILAPNRCYTIFVNLAFLCVLSRDQSEPNQLCGRRRSVVTQQPDATYSAGVLCGVKINHWNRFFFE